MATQPLVLLVSQEHDLCHSMQKILAKIAIKTHIAHHMQQAKIFLSEYNYQTCVTDLDLADSSGLSLIHYIFTQFPQTPVCAISHSSQLDHITTALQHGAFECLSKPIHAHQLQHLVHKAIDQSSHARRQHQTSSKLLLGECPSIQQLRLNMPKIARSDSPIFIGGESGTGKDVVAHLIHQLSDRRNGPLITLNCGAMAEEQMDRELFGQLKDSFTGATQDTVGLIQAAHGGTLFLDEIAELPLTIQVKLLRALQEKKIRPLGSNHEISVDFRILSASHQNLVRRMRNGQFRQDLFYRIHVMDVMLPPLRERGQDVLILAYHFIEQISDDWNICSKRLKKNAQDFLVQYDFAGNVRELRNMIERAFLLSDDQYIDQRHLEPHSTLITAQSSIELQEPNVKTLTPPTAYQGSVAPSPEREHIQHMAKIPEEGLEQFLENIEREILLQALTLTRWNRTLAAKKLGMSFRSLRYRLKKLGLDGTDTALGTVKSE